MLNSKYKTSVMGITRKKKYGQNDFHDFFALVVNYKKGVPREFSNALVYDGKNEIEFKDVNILLDFLLDKFKNNHFCICYDIYYTFGGLTSSYSFGESNITLLFKDGFRILIEKYFKNYSVFSYFVKQKSLSNDIDFVVDLKVLLNAMYIKDVPSSVSDVYTMFDKLEKLFVKWNLNIPYSDITSCSSILKYIFSKLEISGKIFDNLDDINTVLNTYYGSLFEMYSSGRQDKIVSIDMNNAYFSVIRLQNIWRFYICKKQYLVDYDDIDYFIKFVKKFTVDKALVPRLYKSLNYVCYIKFKNAYLPLRYPSRDKYAMNMCYYSGEGWYALPDILSAKLFEKDNTQIEFISVKKIHINEYEPDVRVNLFGKIISKYGFVDELFNLIDEYPEYQKFFKFLMIMVYGNGVERFEKSLGRYYNASFSTLTTSTMRLLTCVIRKMTNVYCVMSDNFVFDEKDIFKVSQSFLPLGISFKIIGIGSIYVNGTDRYYIWNKYFKKYSKHFLGTFVNMSKEDIEDVWESIVFDRELQVKYKAILREIMVNNISHYNLLIDKMKRPLIGDCVYVTFGKSYISHDKSVLEKLSDVLNISDLKRIFMDIESNRLLECGFVLESEFISKSDKSVFIVENSDGYIDSDINSIGNKGLDGQEMIVI